ncbi:Protein mlo2 [Fusarium oxysporum f. sp. albedinis]|nr:Protein mlo2 [Fusarium oxysporum f. sp. albedinis]
MADGFKIPPPRAQKVNRLLKSAPRADKPLLKTGMPHQFPGLGTNIQSSGQHVRQRVGSNLGFSILRLGNPEPRKHIQK